MEETAAGSVEAVCASPVHRMAKEPRLSIALVAGVGVEGDAHAGATVQHRSRLRREPDAPNLRQVHLLGVELLDRLTGEGYPVTPGRIGENVLTRGLDLLALPRRTRLHLGADAVVELTGLRNPCRQLEGVGEGLMATLLEREPDGSLRRLAGVMAIVRSSGELAPGDPIRVALPAGTQEPLAAV